MPPKVKVTREQIVQAALALVRESGAQALNARAVANRLGCSTQPVFSNYATMEELKLDVLRAADECYQAHLAKGMRDPAYPPYKASGVAYIGFARQERELFKLLFMRDRRGEKVEEAARLDLWAGSPPHMRGKVLGRLGAFQARGITPAHAGKRSGYQTAI